MLSPDDFSRWEQLTLQRTLDTMPGEPAWFSGNRFAVLPACDGTQDGCACSCRCCVAAPSWWSPALLCPLLVTSCCHIVCRRLQTRPTARAAARSAWRTRTAAHRWALAQRTPACRDCPTRMHAPACRRGVQHSSCMLLIALCLCSAHRAQCPKCLFVFCSLCNEGWHPGAARRQCCTRAAVAMPAVMQCSLPGCTCLAAGHSAAFNAVHVLL